MVRQELDLPGLVLNRAIPGILQNPSGWSIDSIVPHPLLAVVPYPLWVVSCQRFVLQLDDSETTEELALAVQVGIDSKHGHSPIYTNGIKWVCSNPLASFQFDPTGSLEHRLNSNGPRGHSLLTCIPMHTQIAHEELYTI